MTDQNRLQTKKQWLFIANDENYAEYESFSVNTAPQIYLLTKRLTQLKRDNPLKTPMFIALSDNGSVIDAEKTVVISPKNTDHGTNGDYKSCLH